MVEHLQEPLLSQLNEFVTAQMGLHFPKERWRDLERGIGSAARELDFKDTESCIQWLVSSPLTKRQIEILASHLTVGETYFFREKQYFKILEEQILPALIQSRRPIEQRLRIWSAGCCTGEEPYSIAILLYKLIPDLKDWNITILATDINPSFLKKASTGVYNEWSFRETPAWVKERYFRSNKEGRFEVLPEIKQRVTFSYLNLAEDNYPALLNNTNAMDLIFCRNVLMYFGHDRAKKVIQNHYRSLINGGWLIVSPSEASHILFSQYVTVNFPGAILYKKDSGRPQTVETFPYRTVEEPKSLSELPLDLVKEPQTDAASLQEYLPLENKEQETSVAQPNRYKEAVALYEQGRYGEALEKIAGLLSNDQDDVKAIVLLARVYANQGRLGEALEWCKKAIVADKLNPGYYYLLATILEERGQVVEAAESLKRALYLDQNFVLAHFAAGNLSQRLGKLKESEKHFENAISLLSVYQQNEILPESEGMTAGRLIEIIRSTRFKETVV